MLRCHASNSDTASCCLLCYRDGISVWALFWLYLCWRCIAFDLFLSSFFPPSEDPTFKLEIELPIGTPISKTTAITTEIEGYLTTLKYTDDRDGILNWAAFVGNGGPRYVLSHTAKPASPNYAFFIINTNTGEVVDQMMHNIDSYLFDNFPDVSFSTRKIENGAPISNPIEIRIMGNESEQLFTLASSVKKNAI